MYPDIAAASTLEEMIRVGTSMLSGSSSPHLDARVLARHVLHVSEAGLIANARTSVEVDAKRRFDELIMRRAVGEPIAYITEFKEFWGLNFHVTRDVLIPRADSECIIETVLARRDQSNELRILDLGTGSGCLLCGLLCEYRAATGLGIDISPEAIDIATGNADRLGLSDRAEFRTSDWFENVDGQFDVIVANAPYIPERERGALPVDVSEFEPELALFGGADGTAAYRVIFDTVEKFIRAGGLFLIEYSTPAQGVVLRGMLMNSLTGVKIDVFRDLAARERGAVIRFAK